MNITGKVHAIMETQQVTPTFRKREFVIEFSDNPEYPQYCLFQLIQDRAELIENYNVGDMVDVSFNLRGRQWNSPSGETKFFNSLEAWRINPIGVSEQASPGRPAQRPASKPVAQVATAAVPADADDLPF